MSVVINGSAGVTTNSGAVYNGISAGTAVASTSGTSIDFTSIPSWVKRITVIFSGVSTSGSSVVLFQLGSGSIQTTGYVGSASTLVNSAAAGVAGYTAGLGTGGQAAADARSGHAVFTLTSGNTWVASYNATNASGTVSTAGSTVTLSGTLDRIRITTANGTDTFDAGSINILYE